MKSEVEKNQKLVQVNDILYFINVTNCERWTVIKLFNGGFVAKDDYEEKAYLFCELQNGWIFSNQTKEQNFLNYRFRYAS